MDSEKIQILKKYYIINNINIVKFNIHFNINELKSPLN